MTGTSASGSAGKARRSEQHRVLLEYRAKAIGHAQEFVDLGLSRRHIERLGQLLDTRERCETFLRWARAHEVDVAAQVCLGPLERVNAIREASGDNADKALGFTLAGYQFCRRAVLAYDSLAKRGGDFSPAAGYRESTVIAALLFKKLPKQVWRMWPPQWGRSPFINDQYYVDDKERDFIFGLDTYDPWRRAQGSALGADALAVDVGPPWARSAGG
jgi:hypothetical protein